jgi:hypothetical protein
MGKKRKRKDRSPDTSQASSLYLQSSATDSTTTSQSVVAWKPWQSWNADPKGAVSTIVIHQICNICLLCLQEEDSEVESLLSSPSKAGHKLGKWASKGRARRLSRLLSRASPAACKQLLKARDSYGLTPLHNACAHGHTDAVLVLLQ